MAPDVPTINRDADLEWLDLIRPTGLVLSPTVIKERGLVPERQTGADSAGLATCLGGQEGPALPEPWRLFAEILGWDAGFVAGAPGGAPLPDDLAFAVPEHETTLFPDWAVQGFGGDAPWQLLVRLEPAGVDPDRRGESDGWEASPHQRFERLLRETGVLVGVLISDHELRLIYAPKGETSGWLAFPLRSLATVAGRPMLAGLKLVLGRFRLFNAPADQRLRALLKASRDAQAAVSTELSAQVLGALHELLRGLNGAEPALIQGLAEHRSDHLYEGLLAVLLRLVFILYAEDRDLLPSATDGRSRGLYEQSYSVRGLFAGLVEDAALNPDTMEERLGGWGRLLALFRLIHKGHASGFIRARRGKLFDPDVFPFLEGRSEPADPPRVIKLSDGCLLRILEGLMTLPDPRSRVRQRLSYRTLDVEQIGSVYETIMGFTVQSAPGRVLAIKAGKHNRTPVFADLDQLAALRPAERARHLKEVCKRDGTLPRSVATALGQAAGAAALAAALDPIADERGSPRRSALGAGTPILQPTEERRRTGSHYTPRDLTEPIVRHALRPILERLGTDAAPAQILDLKVCDPAMGSGAFLVEACRQLAERLVAAWARHPGTRPPIPADEDEDLLARRLIAQRCLYGVDKNPMAVDLARLSLWLATLARDHEFTFLDHALKAGDSLVGLDLDQIEALHWDVRGSDAQLTMTRLYTRERLQKVERLRAEIREAGEDASEDDLRPILLRAQAQLADPKLLGDAVIAAFFKGAKAKEREAVRAEVQAAVETDGPGWRHRLSPLLADRSVAAFHWPLEFPEVFDRPNAGFDTIIGNPPYLGGTKISAVISSTYFDWLAADILEGGDKADLIAYFFRRIFSAVRNMGTLGILATSSITEGDTRKAALSWVRQNNGQIYRASKKALWPGEANVHFHSFNVAKGFAFSPCELDGYEVTSINSFLRDSAVDFAPSRLRANMHMCFEGFVPYGDGFIVNEGPDSAYANVKSDELAAVTYPYLGGLDVTESPHIRPSRKIIYLAQMGEHEVRNRFPEIYSVLKETVRPYRLSKSQRVAKAPWWQFLWPRPGLFRRMAFVRSIVVTSRVSKHHAFVRTSSDVLPSTRLSVITSDDFHFFAIIQSRIHETWANYFRASRGATSNYAPKDCFETFPFPSESDGGGILDAVGEAYHRFRAELMVARDKGLTRTYNDFHDRSLRNDREIDRLRELHHAMDQAVLRAYGWDDLAEAAEPIFLDEGNEDEFAYQGRLFWPSEFRDEVLARLLALNAERHADEVRRGVAPRQGGRGRATGSEPEDEEEDAA
jgi:hypothetical protein